MRMPDAWRGVVQLPERRPKVFVVVAGAFVAALTALVWMLVAGNGISPLEGQALGYIYRSEELLRQISQESLVAPTRPRPIQRGRSRCAMRVRCRHISTLPLPRQRGMAFMPLRRSVQRPSPLAALHGSVCVSVCVAAGWASA